MHHKPLNPLEKVLASLPGWIFLVAGLSTLAAAVIMPAWLENRQLAWQRDWLKAQVSRLEEQQFAYNGFIDSMQQHDPVLLQRVAYHYLRLKPQGTTVLDESMNFNTPEEIHLAGNTQPSGTDSSPQPLLPLETQFANAEAWLQKPLPQPGVDLPRLESPPSRLVRFTTGPLRLLVIAMASLLVVIGLRQPREV